MQGAQNPGNYSVPYARADLLPISNPFFLVSLRVPDFALPSRFLNVVLV